MGKYKYKSKTENATVTTEATGTIINDPEFFEFSETKTKTVFDIQSDRTGNIATCVDWSKRRIKKGDKVRITGQIKNGVFIIWTLLKYPSNF